MEIKNTFSKAQTAEAGEVVFDKKISQGKKRLRLIHNNSMNHTLLNFAINRTPPKLNAKNYVQLKVAFDQGGAETVYVNVNSLAKRLHLNKKEILERQKQPGFESYLLNQIQTRQKEIESEFNSKKFDSKTTSKASLKKFSVKVNAVFSDLVLRIAMGASKIPFLRSTSLLSSKKLHDMSEARAVREYHKASHRVPAYKAFLQKHEKAKKFNQVPVTDKATYITPNCLKSTLIDGKLPRGGQVDTSTGTTGKPTVWVRSAKEREFNRKIMNRVRKELIGAEAFFINAYALGGLSTGLTVHGTLVDENLLSTTGPDCDKVLEMVQKFGDQFDQIVISGYPSFMSLLIDAAEKKGVELKKYHLVAVVGGEAISETLRDRLTGGAESNSLGAFKKVISGYGASDLDINIGFETDFCVHLRKECLKNGALAQEFFGDKKGSPAIFQYNPLLYYVETDSDSNLIYTSISGEKISPRVRYNSHDIGMVLTAAEVKAKLKKFNLDFKPANNNLPYIFVWGREGSAASYFSAKMIPEELERAIQNIAELKDKVENYALRNYENEKGNKELDFLIELKEGLDPSTINLQEVNGKILNEIRAGNMDFKRMDEIAERENAKRPELKLFSFGTGPMANQPSHVKKQRLFDCCSQNP